MKKSFLSVGSFTMLTVALAVLALCSCASTEVFRTAGGEPYGATTIMTAKYGVKVVDAPKPIATRESTITISAPKALPFIARARKDGVLTGDKDALSKTVERIGPSTFKLSVTYPETGVYRFMLLVPEAGAPGGFAQLGEWRVTVTEAGISAKPADWYKEYTPYKEYGMNVLEGPKQRDVGPEVSITVSSAQDLDLIATVFRPGQNTSSLDATIVEKTAARVWRITVLCPDTGEFLVRVSVKRADDQGNTYYGAVDWKLLADLSQEKFFYSQFERSGLKVLSEPQRSCGNVASVAISSAQEISLTFELSNLVTKQRMDSQFFSSFTGRETIDFLLPEAGEYALMLKGKAKNGNRNYPLARWTFRAAVDEGFAATERFAAYGLSVLAGPTVTPSGEIEIPLVSTKELSLSCTLFDAKTGKNIKATAAGKTKNGWTLLALMPESGHYRLVLSGKLDSDAGYRTYPLARWTVKSEVTEKRPVLTYSRWKGDYFQKIPLLTTAPAKKEDLSADIDEPEKYEVGILAAPMELQLTSEVVLPLRKGAGVIFKRGWTTLPLDRLLYTVEEDGIVKVGSHNLAFPKGTRFTVTQGWNEATLPGPATFTIGRVRYASEGAVYFLDEEIDGGDAQVFYLRLAADMIVTAGKTKIPCPAGTALLFEMKTGRLHEASFPKNMRIQTKDKLVPVEEGMYARFDAEGNIVKIHGGYK